MELTPLRIFWSVLAVGLAVGIMVTDSDASPAIDAARVGAAVAGMPPANTPENDVITAVPPNAFNPDAGLGLARGASRCIAGFSAYNIENESATPVYVCWRRGTTKANYTTVCRKRCNGCAGGISANGEIYDAQQQLYVIAGVATDAGIQVSLECAR